MIFTLLTGCGPLPRSAVKNPLLAKLPTSGTATGLILQSADSNYTSTAVYWYDFATGAVSPLSGSESGDVFSKWDGARLWVFNRASGRLSYSFLSPKSGGESRSSEFSSLSKVSGDPVDVAWTSDGTTVLVNASAAKLDFAHLASGALTQEGIGDVETGNSSVPFRPGVAVEIGDDVAVFHQQLDTSWAAKGAGMVYMARKNTAGQYKFLDFNSVATGVQGFSINVTNPDSLIGCSKKSTSCYVAGACYESFGSSCVGGIDAVTWAERTVQNVTRLNAGTFTAGRTIAGPSSATAITCEISNGQTQATLSQVDLRTGATLSSMGVGAKTCGALVSDEASKRVYLAVGTVLFELDENLAVVSRQSLPWTISAMEVVNE